MSRSTDPMAVLDEHAPELSDDEVTTLLRSHWGIGGRLKSLVSERDQNFRVDADDGSRYVLKIANAAEPPEVTDFQVSALVHIAGRKAALDLPMQTPEIRPTTDGRNSIRVERAGSTHVTRLVTFVPGTPIGDEPVTPALARNLGTCLAALGLALEGFSHPGSGHSLMWDLQQALALRELVRYIDRPGLAAAVSDTLDDFERFVQPVFPSLRRQVIHSDLNPDNVLLESPGGAVVSGIIDFGDMLEAPLVADVAIGTSYLRTVNGDPLSLVAEFLSAYHAVNPLTADETDLLYDLVTARLCASIAIHAWRAGTREGDDPYLSERFSGVGVAESFLLTLRDIPREHARRTFRQVCASAVETP